MLAVTGERDQRVAVDRRLADFLLQRAGALGGEHRYRALADLQGLSPSAQQLVPLAHRARKDAIASLGRVRDLPLQRPGSGCCHK